MNTLINGIVDDRFNYTVTKRIRLFLFFIVITVGCRTDSSNRDTSNLQDMVKVIEQYKVQAFRNQDWCKNISYSRGKFSDNSKASTCNLFDGAAREFDAQADVDFIAIARALDATGVDVSHFEVEFDSAGKIIKSEFSLDCLACSRRRYVYSPDFAALPKNVPNEMWFTKIDSDWYIVEEDWN